MTQVVLAPKISDCKMAYLANLSLKVNTKLNGVNNHLEAMNELPVLGLPEPTMIFGADISHGQNKDDKNGSCSSLVGTIDQRSNV